MLNGKSELDLYLEEPKLVGHKDLDVLEYWRDCNRRFGDLGMMAREILSIPIITVASESAFSIGGRILSKYRSSMLSTNLQALICTRNWLLGFSQNGKTYFLSFYLTSFIFGYFYYVSFVLIYCIYLICRRIESS